MHVDPIPALQALAGCDVAGLDVAGIVDAAHRSRRVRGWLDAFDAALSARSDQLHAAGRGVAAEELAARCGGVSAVEGRRRGRRSRVLDKAPSLAAALAAGAVGAEHADQLANLTSRLEPEIAESFFSHEADLAVHAKGESPEVFGRRCRHLLSRLEAQAGIDRDQRQRRQTRLWRRIDSTGMHHVSGVLHPELGAAIFAAVDAEVAALVAAGSERGVDREQLAAEALGNLVGGGHQRRRPGEPEISVVIDARTLCEGEHDDTVSELSNGVAVSAVTVRRWCCQGVVIPIVFDPDTNNVAMGREIRFANRAQKRALRAMYRGCAFPGCDIAVHRTEAHHLHPWESGGATDLDNLLPLCARHHHLAHEGGWSLQLAADRTLSVYRPDGQLHATATIDIKPQGQTAGTQPRPARQPGPEPPPPPLPRPPHPGGTVTDAGNETDTGTEIGTEIEILTDAWTALAS